MSVEIISTEDELSKQNEKNEEKKDCSPSGDPTGWTLINGMWVMESSLKPNKPQYTHNPVKINRRLKRSFVHKAETSTRPNKKKTYTELELYVYKKIQLETEKLIDSILTVIDRCIRSNLSYIYQVSKIDKEILRLDNNLEMRDIFDYRMVYINLEKQKQHIEESIKTNFERAGLADLEKHYEKMKENNKSQRMAIEVNDESKKYASIKKCIVSTVMSMKKTLNILLKFNNKFPICEDTAVFLGIRKNVLQLQQSDRRVLYIMNETNIPEFSKFLRNDDLGFQYTIFNFETLSIQELEKKLNQIKLVSAKLEEDKNKVPQEFLLSCDDSIGVENLGVPAVCMDLPWWITQEFNPDIVKHELDRLRQNAKEIVKLDKDMLTDNIVKYFQLNLHADEEKIMQNLDNISICKTYMEIFEGMVLLSEDIAKKEFEIIKLENSDIENKIKFLHKHKAVIKKTKCQRKDEPKKLTAKEIFSKEKYGICREMMEEELRRLRKIVVFALHKALKKSMPFQPSSDEQHYLGLDHYTFQTKADYQHAVKHLDNLRDHLSAHANNMFGECTPEQLVDHYTNIRLLNGDVFNENQENDTLEMVENMSLQTVAKEIIKLKRGLLVVLSHIPNYSVKRDTTDLLGIWKGLDSRTGCAKKDFYQELLDFLANDDPGTKFMEFQQRYPNQEQLEQKTEEIKIAYAKVYHELLNVPEDVKSSLVQNHRDILTRPSLKKQGDSRQSTSREHSWENESCSRDRVDKSNLPDLKVEIEASRAAKGLNEFSKSHNLGWQVDRGSVPDLKVEMEASRPTESFNQIPNNYSLGWQEYVNVHMIQRGLSEAAIVGLDGSVWAKSNGFHIQKSNIDEILKLFQQFSTVSPATLGFNFSGQVYSFVSRTESVIIGKQRAMGVIFRKTKNAILIGAFKPYGSLEQSTGELVLSTLGDHLLQSGF